MYRSGLNVMRENRFEWMSGFDSVIQYEGVDDDRDDVVYVVSDSEQYPFSL